LVIENVTGLYQLAVYRWALLFCKGNSWSLASDVNWF